MKSKFTNGDVVGLNCTKYPLCNGAHYIVEKVQQRDFWFPEGRLVEFSYTLKGIAHMDGNWWNERFLSEVGGVEEK